MTAFAGTEQAIARADDEGADLRGRTILVAHLSAELYGSDRVLLERRGPRVRRPAPS